MNTRKKLTNMVLLALFVALIVLLGMTPIGMIPLGFCKVTLLVIPVAVGTIFMGLKSGLVLGLAFGCVSLISATMIDPAGNGLAFALFGASPVLGALVCILPRLIVPVMTHLTYQAARKWKEAFASMIGAVCGSLTNTFLYLGAMWLCYSFVPTLEAAKVLGVILGVGAIAGSCEAVAAGIICPAILTAMRKLKK